MVHAVSIHNGFASYACCPVFPKAIGELHGHSGIARLLLFYAKVHFGIVNHAQGTGVANAGLVYFNHCLLAMSEDDFPYQVRIAPSSDLETVGRYNFQGQLWSAMIAHPKLDPVSGKLFDLFYGAVQKPYLKYYSFSPNGQKSPNIEIPVDEPTMMHDIAITNRFVKMIRGGSLVVYDKNKISRFGILDKNVADALEIRWVEAPDCFFFHLWNVWEDPETNEIVVIGSCMTPLNSLFNECEEGLKSVLSEICLNPRTGKSTRPSIISDPPKLNLEAGMVPPNTSA
uniref:9-cis-epoxycarotenoid dioxygenase n=1 Tax=Nelumbo nucifera TaxID=4432 RepID=A0A822XYG8_NELNU|nr:TPA_asm: hypothetical protein HUJ06_026526 [Nelumbo nucifera]